MCLNRTTSGPPETLHFAENCSVTSKEKFGGPVFPPNPANRETIYGRRDADADGDVGEKNSYRSQF